MKALLSLTQYFWKYKFRLTFGILFTILANYFGVLSPQVARYIINKVKEVVTSSTTVDNMKGYDPFFFKIITWIDDLKFGSIVVWCGFTLVFLALLKGFFTYLMRQTLIVMSRHIEFDQKNDIYKHYQSLDLSFLKQNSTGDLMNRISDDVSKVRMFTGPAVMYFTNMLAMVFLCVWFMLQKSVLLTLCTLAPLPILAYVIFKVNTIINKKSEQQQQQLSTLTSNAQESYSGIRVIKAFMQEQSLWNVFNKNSDTYKDAAISLAKTEAWYFPSIALLIGVSTLITIMVGGLLHINNQGIDEGTIAEFVMYVSMLSFPFSSIGWVASIIQKANTSQRRIKEFLDYKSPINDNSTAGNLGTIDEISFNNVSFNYTDTGIQALKEVSFSIKKGQKIAIVGHTGSGKTTLVQLMLRLLEPQMGDISINGQALSNYTLNSLRKNIGYVPQEVFLFSDTIAKNIAFGGDNLTNEAIVESSKNAFIYNEIMSFNNQFETMVGERGVTLSGGQKQRISIARALLKNTDLIIFDDCLSAVDVNTEIAILEKWRLILENKITVFVTHRVTHLQDFDKIMVFEDGKIVEEGTHIELIKLNKEYKSLFSQQNRIEN